LSGTLVCGDCGATLRGLTENKRYYICRNATFGLCPCRRMDAARVEGLLAEMARDTLLAPDLESRLRAELAKQAGATRKVTPNALKAMRAEVAKLDRQIERGTRNLLLADPADVPAAKAMLADWRKERDAAQARLDAAQAPSSGSTGTIEETVERAISKLRAIAGNLEAADPAVSREAFRSTFQAATLYWHARRIGQRHWHPAKLVVESRMQSDFPYCTS
jgi:hypothetical protein